MKFNFKRILVSTEPNATTFVVPVSQRVSACHAPLGCSLNRSCKACPWKGKRQDIQYSQPLA